MAVLSVESPYRPSAVLVVGALDHRERAVAEDVSQCRAGLGEPVQFPNPDQVAMRPKDQDVPAIPGAREVIACPHGDTPLAARQESADSR